MHKHLLLGLLLTMTTSACTTPSTGNHARAVSAGESFELGVGESAALGGDGTLHYDELVNDSRCPPGVQCIWAGDAEVRLTWTPSGAAADTFSLHTNTEPRNKPLGANVLSLQALAPGENPRATLVFGAASN